MKRMLRSNVTSLVLVGAVFINFLVICLLTIFEVGGSEHCHVYYNGRTYIDYCNIDYYSLYTDSFGIIFIPIISGILAILVPLTILNLCKKLRYVKLHKFMSAFDFLAIFGLILPMMILIWVNLRFSELTYMGLALCITMIETMVLSLIGAFVSFYQFWIMLENPTNNKQRAEATNSTLPVNAVDNLKALKELYDQGILTEEEYNEKKKKYIDLL